MKKVTVTAQVITSDDSADSIAEAIHGAASMGMFLARITHGIIEEDVTYEIEDYKQDDKDTTQR